MASPARSLETDWPRQRPTLASDDSHDVGDVAKKLGVEEELSRLLAATKGLFPGPVEVRIVHDLEYPDEIYFEVNVTAMATVEELVARDRRWYEQCLALTGTVAHYFCLSFVSATAQAG